MMAFLKRKKYWVISVAIILLIVIVSSRSGARSGDVDTATVSRGEVLTTVSVTGRVKSAEAVDLGFERAGKVASVKVDVGTRVYAGQLLATLSMGDLLANLDRAKAKVKAEEASLAALKIGQRPEDVSIAKSKYDTALLTTENKKTLLNNARVSAYIKTQNDFAYYVDQFFSNPHSVNPQVSIPLRGDYKSQIESGRVGIEDELMTQWTDEATALAALNNLRVFASLMGVAINDLSTTAQLPAATIDGYKTAISTTRADIETEMANIISASQAYTDAIAAADLAKRQYELASSPARPEDIAAGEARLAQALAEQRSAAADVTKSEIFAPFAGVIARQDFKLGQSVSSNDALISLIDDLALDIEVKIPEADIADVRVGQVAEVDLDAYSSGEKFNATIVAIDPGETIVDGVATYKTTLHFVDKDERIRSGMTANAIVVTNKKSDVLIVPNRMITNEEGKSYVFVGSNPKKAVKTEIMVGLRGSDGKTEVSGNIKEGDTIVLVK